MVAPACRGARRLARNRRIVARRRSRLGRNRRSRTPNGTVASVADAGCAAGSSAAPECLNGYDVPKWCKAPSPSISRIALRLQRWDGTESSLDVSERPFYVLGRQECAHLAMAAEPVSRYHAVVLRCEKGKLFIVDLRSTNGTYIDGHRIETFEPYELSESNVVRFGSEVGRSDVQWEEAHIVAAACTAAQSTSTSRSASSVRRCFDASNIEEKRTEAVDSSAVALVKKCASPAEQCHAGGGTTVKQQGEQRQSSEHRPQKPKAEPDAPPLTKKRRLDVAGGSVATASAAPGGCSTRRSATGASAIAAPAAPAANKGTAAAAGKKCDKCDGPHATDACPHFKKSREQHKDAWVNYGKKSPLQMGADGGNFLLRNARMVRQPGDGSCLFHSLCFGLNGGGRNSRNGGGSAAHSLRRELANFIAENPRLEIAGDTLEEWVRWDANTDCSRYARRMAQGGWGGGIEMAACSRLKKVNVHVYESSKGGKFKRISCFNNNKAQRTIHVLYQGRMHYDALVVN